MSEKFSFNISLSVLNHLGRNLYRNFSTILGEAISNAWDADAENVYITIKDDENYFSIEDDGIGMTSDDFQNKFLKVGYSKRKDNKFHSKLNRPYIGRKGIGKLALISCAETITIVSKTSDTNIIGGVIDNTELDKAISEDNEQYPLKELPTFDINTVTFNKNQGTYIRFNNINEGINHSIEYLRKIIALYFRFSIIDNNFNIYVNGEKITTEDLNDLINKTEFVWDINNTGNDSYLDKIKAVVNTKDKCKFSQLSFKLSNGDVITGFIISVEKPSYLKIRNTDDTVTVDLFVNGRLREKDILKHIRTNRVPESYLYGQINYNALDDAEDRFTSSRESIKAEDPKFQEFLSKFKSLLYTIMDQWDDFRIENKREGESDNTRKITKKERKARELYNETVKEYKDESSHIKDVIDTWIDCLEQEATFNFQSYAECFTAENLIRNYITHKNIQLSQEATNRIRDLKGKESNNKNRGGVNITIRKNNNDNSYLDMDDLSNLIDKGSETYRLSIKAKTYKPVRDAMMHTSVLSNEAKTLLTSIFNDIKERIKNLLKN